MYGQAESKFQQASSQAINAAPPSTALTDIHERLIQLRDALQRSANTQQEVLDRAFGGAPTKDTTAKPRECRTGAVGNLLDLLDDIAGLANWHDEIAQRAMRLI